MSAASVIFTVEEVGLQGEILTTPEVTVRLQGTEAGGDTGSPPEVSSSTRKLGLGERSVK